MKIGVIMGGISSEREVSLNSGREILNNMDKERYEPVEVLLDRKDDIYSKVEGIDFALLALHGKYGEDGTVQAILNSLDIPFSGCGVLSSAMCMDKDITKTILRQKEIRTADWTIIRSMDELVEERIASLGYPVVVKPNSGGSSVATFICKDFDEVRAGVEEGFGYDTEIMVEKFIKGDEITIPILGGEALPTLIIKAQKGSFFDYKSKYEDDGAVEEIIELPEALQKEVNQMARDAYAALKCEVYARIDFMVKDGVPYLLELNTLPGMTKNSLFPKSARGVGLSYKDLISRIIQISMENQGIKDDRL
ncbi:MAG TPA: D-alanine--D-alanine ligase [Clostridiaceae bacterium]|nr:D-alanine--D-alanine ligase [Clostridiaceae bacterium]